MNINKYQKAINLINIAAYSQYEDACYNMTTKAKAMQHEKHLKSSAYLLQELVDKEMPRSAIFTEIGDYIDNSHSIVVQCPECKFSFERRTKYCSNCGQRMDWGVKENKNG